MSGPPMRSLRTSRIARLSAYQKNSAPARPVLERNAFSQFLSRTWFTMLRTRPTELMTAPTPIVKPKKARIFPGPVMLTKWSTGWPKRRSLSQRVAGSRITSLAKNDP